MTAPGRIRLDVVGAMREAPIARWLNYSAEEIDGELIHRLGFSEQHIGNPAIRALHGGVIASFLEFAAQVELCARLGKSAALRTVSISIDYMLSSKPQDMRARVTVDRAARRVAFLQATGWQNDQSHPVASARVCLRIGE